MATPEYRVKERVGTGQFMIQKKFYTQRKEENPSKLDKFIFRLFGHENIDIFEWRSLAYDNTFTNSYYDKYYKYFDSFEEANKVAKKLRENEGEVKYHTVE